MKSLIALLVAATPAFAQNASLKTPNVSGDGLFLYRHSNMAKEDNSETRNGIDLQEAELAFYSDVDPYSRLSMLFSVHPDYKADKTTGKVVQTWGFGPEELFAETDHIPGVTLRVGKFKAAFGKHNVLHAHAFPFVDAPLINSVLLGDEGLNDVGVSAAYMLPLPWFSELTAQYLRGEGQEDENPEFHSPTPGDGVGLGRWKNLWDLGESTTLEAGISYAHGGNQIGSNTQLAGGDLTVKWRPVAGGRYHSAIMAVEYIDRQQGQKGTTQEHGYGISTWGQFQFAERWSVKGRYETLQVTGSDPIVNPSALPNALTQKESAMLQFDLTEFSFLRFEYDHAHGPPQTNGVSDENKFFLQANFTIGSHPAHTY